MPQRRFRYNDWVQNSPDAYTEYDALIGQALEGDPQDVGTTYMGIPTVGTTTANYDPNYIKQAQDLRSRGMTVSPGDDVNARLYHDQGGGEMIGRTLGNILNNSVLDIVENIGSAFDFLGGRPDYQNALTKWASSKKDAFGDVYLRDPEATFDMGSAAWWLNHGKDLASSIAAFGIMGAGVSTALSKGALTLSRMIKGSLDAQKVAKYGAGIDKLLQGTANMSSAATLAYAEGTLSGAQTYNAVYQREFERTNDANYAEEMAAKAAANTVKINTAMNTALNVTSLAPFFKHGADSQLRRNVNNKLYNRKRDGGIRLSPEGGVKPKGTPFDDAARAASLEEREVVKGALGKKSLKELKEHIESVPNIKSAVAEYLKRTGKKATYESIQEALEELNNIWSEKLGEEGRDLGYMFRSPGEALAEYWEVAKSDEGRLSMFLGAIGGAGNTGFIAAMPSIKREVNEKTGKKRLKVSSPKELQEVREEMAEFATAKKAIIDDVDDLIMAEALLNQGIKEDNQTKIEEAKQQFFNIKARQSVQNGQTDLMISMMEEIQSLDNTRPLDETSSFSEAEVLGFADNSRDNEYVATAQRQINVLKKIADAYDNTLDFAKSKEKENPGYTNFLLSTLTDFYSYNELSNQKISDSFKTFQKTLQELGGTQQLETFDTKGFPETLKEVVDVLRSVLKDDINKEGAITLFSKDHQQALEDAFDKLKKHKASDILSIPEIKAAFEKIGQALEFNRKATLSIEAFKHFMTNEGVKEYKENNKIEEFKKKIEDSIDEELYASGQMDNLFDDKFWYDLEQETGITQEAAKAGEEFVIKLGNNAIKVKYEPELDENLQPIVDEEGNPKVTPKIVSSIITDEDSASSLLTVSAKSSGFFAAAKNDEVEYYSADQYDKIYTELLIEQELAEIDNLLQMNEKNIEKRTEERKAIVEKLNELEAQIKAAKKKFSEENKTRITKKEFLRINEEFKTKLNELRNLKRKVDKDLRLFEDTKLTLEGARVLILNQIIGENKRLADVINNQGLEINERYVKATELLKETSNSLEATNSMINTLKNLQSKMEDVMYDLAEFILYSDAISDFETTLKIILENRDKSLGRFSLLQTNNLNSKLEAFEKAKNELNPNMIALTLMNLVNTLSNYVHQNKQQFYNKDASHTLEILEQIRLINEEFKKDKANILKSLTPEEAQIFNNLFVPSTENVLVDTLAKSSKLTGAINNLENSTIALLQEIGTNLQIRKAVEKELLNFNEIVNNINNLRENIALADLEELDEQSSIDGILEEETSLEDMERAFNDNSQNDYLYHTTGLDILKDVGPDGNPIQNEGFSETWYTYLDKNSASIQQAIADKKLKLKVITAKNIPDSVYRILSEEGKLDQLKENYIIVMPVYQYQDGFYDVKVDKDGNFISPTKGKEYADALPVFNFLPLVDKQLGKDFKDFKSEDEEGKSKQKVTDRALIELFLETSIGQDFQIDDIKEFVKDKPSEVVYKSGEEVLTYDEFIEKAYDVVKSNFEKSLASIINKIEEATDKNVLLDVVGLTKGHFKFPKGEKFLKGEEVITSLLGSKESIVDDKGQNNFKIVLGRADEKSTIFKNQTVNIPKAEGQPFIIVKGQDSPIPVQTSLLNNTEINTVIVLIQEILKDEKSKKINFTTVINQKGEAVNIPSTGYAIIPSKQDKDTLLERLISWNSKNDKYKIYLNFKGKKLIFSNPNRSGKFVSIPFSTLREMKFNKETSSFFHGASNAQIEQLAQFLANKKINVKKDFTESQGTFVAPSINAEGKVVLTQYKNYDDFLKSKLLIPNFFKTEKGKIKHSRNLNLGTNGKGLINTSENSVNSGPKTVSKSGKKKTNYKQPFKEGQIVKVRIYSKSGTKYYTGKVVKSGPYFSMIKSKNKTNKIENYKIITPYKYNNSIKPKTEKNKQAKEPKERKKLVPFSKGDIVNFNGEQYRISLAGSEYVIAVPASTREYEWKNLTEAEQQEIQELTLTIPNDELFENGNKPTVEGFDEEFNKEYVEKKKQVPQFSKIIVSQDALEQLQEKGNKAAETLSKELNIEEEKVINFLKDINFLKFSNVESLSSKETLIKKLEDQFNDPEKKGTDIVKKAKTNSVLQIVNNSNTLFTNELDADFNNIQLIFIAAGIIIPQIKTNPTKETSIESATETKGSNFVDSMLGAEPSNLEINESSTKKVTKKERKSEGNGGINSEKKGKSIDDSGNEAC